jgi:transcriptional regulator with XRE-family HTH domain
MGKAGLSDQTRLRLMKLAGPTTAGDIERYAANLLKTARAQLGLTQQEVATRSGVAKSTVARIESATMQPSIPTLETILLALGLELRINLAPFDDHDKILDARAAADPVAHETNGHILDELLASAHPVNTSPSRQ